MLAVKRRGYAFVSMPDGSSTRIPIEQSEPFDLDEAREFEQAAKHRGHTNILALLADLRKQGLSPQEATGVVCTYLDLLEQRKQR